MVYYVSVMTAPLTIQRNGTVPLREQIATHLRAQIESGRLQPGDKLPTLRELEKRCGVARRTVKAAIDLLAARKLVVKQPPRGTFVTTYAGRRPGESSETTGAGAPSRRPLRDMVCGICVQNDFFDHRHVNPRNITVAQTVETTLSHSGARSVYLSENQLKALPADVNALLLLRGVNLRDFQVMGYLHSGLPVVGVDYYGDTAINTVREDWSWTMREAVDHLVHLGHRRIALLSYAIPEDSLEYRWMRERETAFCNSLYTHELPVSEQDIYRLADWRRRYTEEAVTGGELAIAPPFLKGGRHYTACVAVNDILAVAVHRALTRAGRRIPEEMSIIGFDDIQAAQQLGLTTVRPDSVRDGRIAADMLADLFENPNPTRLQQVETEPELIIRSSTARVSAHPASNKEETPDEDAKIDRNTRFIQERVGRPHAS